MSSRIALVTGANKGIGFAVVEILAKDHPDWVVYLGARSKERGETAVNELKAKGLNNVRFGLIDIEDIATIQALRDHLKKEHDGLDVLVNNAGIAYKVASTAPVSEQAEVSVKTNFYGTLNTSKTLIPILRPHARIVNVSSRASVMAYGKCSDALKARIDAKDLNRDSLTALMDEFVAATKAGNHVEKGFADSPYGMSKIGVTLMTYLQQKYLSTKDADMVANACCPGYVNTDMTSGKGVKTPEEGADTVVYLATLPEKTECPKGDFVADRKIIKMNEPVTMSEKEMAVFKKMREQGEAVKHS